MTASSQAPATCLHVVPTSSSPKDAGEHIGVLVCHDLVGPTHATRPRSIHDVYADAVAALELGIAAAKSVISPRSHTPSTYFYMRAIRV